MVVVPLQQDGEAIGVLKMLSARPFAFTENDVAVLQLMAGFLSSAMLTAMTTHNLHQNEERLREAQRVARIGSWEFDVVSGKIRWSQEAFRLLEFDPAQGTPTYDQLMSRYHPDDVPMHNAIIQQAIQDGLPYEFDIRAVMNDRSVLWLHAVGQGTQDEQGKVTRLFGTLMDVTDRVRAEGIIRQSQESLNHAQAMAHVGSWKRDYRAGTMVWSDELFRLFGLEPDAMTPSIDALFTYIHPLDQQMAQEHMRQAMREGIGADFELRLVGADGVLRHIHLRTKILTDEAGLSIGSHGTLTDITQRVIATQEQTKFVSLIENSSDFIAMASLDGMMLTMNLAGRQLVGLERDDEITTHLLSDFMPTGIWEWMKQGILPIVMSDGRWDGECQLINETTGNAFDMQASYFLIRDPVSSEPMCLATVQRDITAAKWQDGQLQQYVLL